MYKNEVDHPAVPKPGKALSGMGCHEFKDEAMNIAYGQAGEKGCKEDYKKIEAQKMNYDWESESQY